MAQLKAKQIRFKNPGDIIVAGDDNNGSLLALGKTPGQALVVKNIGTEDNPKLVPAYDIVSGSLVAFDDTDTSLGATNVQDAIVKLKGSVATALIYTGTVDGSTGVFTPALPSPLKKGTYYQVTEPGSAITTNNTGSANEPVLAGDAVVWNGQYWDVMAHIDAIVHGTTGQISVTGNADAGFNIAIDPTYVGQTSLTTLGTITTGIWNGAKIDLTNGGTNTNLSTAADNSILFKEGTGVSVTTPVNANSKPKQIVQPQVVFNTRGPFNNVPAPYGSPVSPTNTYNSTSVGGISYTINSSKQTGIKPSLFKIENPYTNITVTIKAASGYTVVATAGNGSTTSMFTAAPDSKLYQGTEEQFKSETWSVVSTSDASAVPVGEEADLWGVNGYTVVNDKWMIDNVTVSTTSDFKGLDSSGSPYKDGERIDSVNIEDASPAFSINAKVTVVPFPNSFLSFNPNQNEFVWASADNILDQARKTINITEEFAVVNSDAGSGQVNQGKNAVIDISNTPVNGTVELFINGLRMKSSDFTVDYVKNVLTLNDSAIGYTIDTSDEIQVTYDYISAQ